MRTRSESLLNVIWTLLVRIVIAGAVAYFVWKVRSVLITVVLSVMLAYVLLPAVEFLCNRRFIPNRRSKAVRLIATVLVFAVFFFVVGSAVKLLITPFWKETTRFITQVDVYNNKAQAMLTKATEWYQENVTEDMRQFLGNQDFKQMGSGFTKLASRTVGGIKNGIEKSVDIILIPVLAFYFVLDSRTLKREFMGLVPPWRKREVMRILRDVSGILQSYVVGQLILCVIAGVVTGIVLNWIHMDYVLVLAVLAGVTRAIPIIGPVVSGVPIIALGLLNSTTLGLWLLVFVIIMHFAESKFIMPILIGDRMKLHPALILIVLLIGAEFFGLLGMFLAAPVAAIVRELLYLYVVKPRQNGKRQNNIGEDTTPRLIKTERI